MVTETVNLIGYFTRQHSRSISLVLSGEGDCDDLFDEMELTGNSLPPLFARTSADAAQEQEAVLA